MQVQTTFAFHQQVLASATARTRAAVNLWSYSVKEGELPACKHYKQAVALMQELSGLHPNVLKAQASDFIQMLDDAFDNAFEAISQSKGTLTAISMLKL